MRKVFLTKIVKLQVFGFFFKKVPWPLFTVIEGTDKDLLPNELFTLVGIRGSAHLSKIIGYAYLFYFSLNVKLVV